MIPAHRGALAAVGVVAGVILTVTPLAGWAAVVRLPAVLIPALLAVLLTVRPWRWDATQWTRFDAWTPSTAVVRSAAVAVGLLLFWIVLTRFQSGEINGVDFTVYFDRPVFQTLQGRPLFVETADDLGRAQESLLIIHAYWALYPLALLYFIHATPMWLLALSVVAVVAGAVHILRIVQRLGGGGVLACAAALAFVLNDNTARTLNYGFHVEVLYAWFVPWLIDAGLRGQKASYACAAFACVLVKEDAFMLLFAAAVALGLYRWRAMRWPERAFFLVAPTVLALVNLGVYTRVIVPSLTGGVSLIYGSYWLEYGPTPISAALGMLRHPWRVFERTLTSGFFARVLVPHLFLPLIGWRWIVGAIPIVILYGAATNEQMRSFGIYYSIVLVPFLVLGASMGAMTVAKYLPIGPRRRRSVAAGAILAGALLAGSTSAGYSLRPWRAEIAAMPRVLPALAGERVLLVQSALYPHAGYESRIQLLTPAAVADPRNAGAAILIAPALGYYPFSKPELESLQRLPQVRPTTDGLMVLRLPQ